MRFGNARISLLQACVPAALLCASCWAPGVDALAEVRAQAPNTSARPAPQGSSQSESARAPAFNPGRSDIGATGLRGSINDDVTGALPPAALGRLPGGIGEGLFGSVEVPVRSAVSSDRWRSILAQDPGRYFDACVEGPICAAPLHKAFEAIAGKRGPGLSLEMLRDVNAAVNRAIAFRSDDLVWGAQDYWASPAETAAKGAGDCEDFAIAKFGMLRALGVPSSMMRIAVVKDLRKNIGHALLVVRAGDVSWILDNQAPDVRPDTAVTGYMPLYTLGVDSAWIHGVRRPGPTAAGDVTRPAALKPSLN